MLNQKEERGRDIALCIVDSEDTDVTPDQMKVWPDWDIYEWIEAWGYLWQEGEWVLDDE